MSWLLNQMESDSALDCAVTQQTRLTELWACLPTLLYYLGFRIF